ncbi:FecR domain-containing protein [Niabella pedocola]|uniref:FecR domain-containing protein n=1 Tax=Niabella pedocola TaxID=1752077 RepID=A0ABS8PPY3_9BACT|nr:FecR domain-containing protein [Niabella pedocola]MCD2422824.1 FecR domain-containing protein [Niabella pedocola]
MDNAVTKEMVERFFENQSDEAEAEKVTAFLKAHPEVLQHYVPDAAFRNMPETQQLEERWRTAMWMAVQKGINREKKTRYLQRVLAAAAVLALVLAGYALLNVLGGQRGSRYTELEITVIENPSGKEKELRLPDGSVLRLQPGSRVEYAGTFKEQRQLCLTGTAYFKVAKDSLHPFLVEANGIRVRALGTEFWVQENRQQATIQVNLVEGKIAVRDLDHSAILQPVILIPGEGVLVNRRNGVAQVIRPARSDAARMMAHKTTPTARRQLTDAQGAVVWGNAAYSFNRESLRRVFDRIEQRYHRTIVLKTKEIGDYLFTGTIMYNDSLDVLLEQLCQLNGLRYQQKENQITIEKND